MKKYFITVDDEEQIRRLLKKVAKKACPDCEVHESEDGEQGYACLERLSEGNESKILLFTDHGMPKLNGLDMIKKMDKTGLRKNFKDSFDFYMCFSESQNYGEEIGKEAVRIYGAKGYLKKPVSVTDAKKIIEEYFKD